MATISNILFKAFVSFLTVALVIYLSPVPYAYANPLGGNVSAGSATIDSSGTTETITQKSKDAVIDWTSFNIGGGEKTNFIQPNSSSLTVNRVHGYNPSQIFGSLTANGNLVLINPNGVFFGAGSKVDVSGLVATTSNVANSNVMSGSTMHFTPGGNPNASVANAGTITAADAGLVGLVAPNVQNSGVITAKLGKVQLASGDTFDLDLYGDNLLNFTISGAVGNQIVQNLGQIEADGGTVNLTAAAGRSIVNSMINVEGEIKTPAFKQQDGVIVIYAAGSNAVPGNVTANKGTKLGTSEVTVSGLLDASGKGQGQTGGSISVLGDDVAILGAAIDASGDAGGGYIRIGGDFHGHGNTPTAFDTYLGPNAQVLANAITSGNGGNVAVWSDNHTDFLGNIEAKGGSQSGNGGFVETSGHSLNAVGTVVINAANGSGGTWLLDPNNLTISTSADSNDGSSPNFQANAASSTLNITTLENALNSASAGSTISITASGNILVSSSITESSSNNITLSMSAGTLISQFIGFSGGISATGAGALAINLSGGSIRVAGGGQTIASNGGNISFTGEFECSTGTCTVNSGTGTTTFSRGTTASIPITGVNSTTINVTGTGTTYIGAPITNSFTDDVGTLSFSGPVVLNGSNAISGTSVSFGSTVDDSTANTHNLSITSTNLSLAGAIGGNTPLASLSLTSGSSMTLPAITASTIAAQATSGNITLGGNLTTNGGNVTLTGPVILGGNSTIATSGGAVDFTSTVDGTTSGSQSLSINSGAGTLTFGGAIGGTTPPSSVSLTSGSSFTLPAITAGNIFANSTGGNITLGGNLTSSQTSPTAGVGNSQFSTVLATSGNIINSGNYTISTQSGSGVYWALYSTAPVSDTPGGLTPAQTFYSSTYGSPAPASITGTGNSWLYSSASGGGGSTITITADGQSVIYGGNVPTLTYTCTGSGCIGVTGSLVVSGSNGSVAAGTAATHANGLDVGGYTISEGTLSDSGYTITYNSASLAVGAAPLTVTASNMSGTYGTSAANTLNGTTGFTSSGLVGGETIGSVTLSTNATVSTSGNYNANTGSNPASWMITPSAATGGTFNPSNYSITYVTGTQTISPAALTVSGMTASNKTYDSTTTATVSNIGDTLGGITRGLNNGGGTSDSVSLTGTGSTSGTFASASVGSGIAVTGSGIGITGADAGNYVLAGQPTATANITAASGGGGGGSSGPIPTNPFLTPPAVTTPVVVTTPAATPSVTPTPTSTAIPGTVQQLASGNIPAIWNAPTTVNDTSNVGIPFVGQPAFAPSEVTFQAPGIALPVFHNQAPPSPEAVAPASPASTNSTSEPAVSNGGAGEQLNLPADNSDQKKKEGEKKKARESRLREMQDRISRAGRSLRNRFGNAGPELEPVS